MDNNEKYDDIFNRRRAKRYFFIPIMIIAGVFVFGTIVMLLWNEVVTVVFGIRAINFWQALGLLLLSKIFFSGFHGGGHHRGFRPYPKELREKWMKLPPEEREKMRESLREHFRSFKYKEFGHGPQE